MEKKFDPTSYKNDFAKKNYDRINLIVPKGKKDELKAYAKAEGKSLNEYLNDLIFKKYEML